MAKVQPFKNRIISHEDVDAKTLKAHPLNYRIHPDIQRRALTAVVDDVGWISEVIVNKQTGRIINGHLRVEMAAERGETVPVCYVKLSPAEEKLALATFDSVGQMASIDDAMMNKLLEGIEVGDNPELNGMLDALLTEAQAATPQPVDNPDWQPVARATAAKGNVKNLQIKPVLYAAELFTFERALQKTGIPNRGKALMAICETYLRANDGNEKR